MQRCVVQLVTAKDVTHTVYLQVNQELDYKALCVQLQAELDTKDDILHHLENRLKLAEERV